jgi:hypothetical protein
LEVESGRAASPAANAAEIVIRRIRMGVSRAGPRASRPRFVPLVLFRGPKSLISVAAYRGHRDLRREAGTWKRFGSRY